MAQKQSVQDKEWYEGIKLHFDGGGGKFECANCDWATNQEDKALRHRELFNHTFWMSLLTAIQTHKRLEKD